MTVVGTEQDLDNFCFTITSEFDASVDRVWQLWANPRLLERWWGPPGFPATFTGHDLRAGGDVNYYMTGPEGDKYHGWWRVVSVDAPHGMVFEDGFADDQGRPNPDMPVTVATVSLTPLDAGGTRMVIESRYPSREALEQIMGMGMEEGITLALGQADALLAEVS